MWCLGRLLPLIIGHLVEEHNEYWENYLMHLDIMDEIFAHVYSLVRIPYLRILIEDFYMSSSLFTPVGPLHQRCITLYIYQPGLNGYSEVIYLHVLYFSFLIGLDHYCECGVCAMKPSIVFLST